MSQHTHFLRCLLPFCVSLADSAVGRDAKRAPAVSAARRGGTHKSANRGAQEDSIATGVVTAGAAATLAETALFAVAVGVAAAGTAGLGGAAALSAEG